MTRRVVGPHRCGSPPPCMVGIMWLCAALSSIRWLCEGVTLFAKVVEMLEAVFVEEEWSWAPDEETVYACVWEGMFDALSVTESVPATAAVSPRALPRMKRSVRSGVPLLPSHSAHLDGMVEPWNMMMAPTGSSCGSTRAVKFTRVSIGKDDDWKAEAERVPLSISPT